jgi:hypothetical protein
MTNFIYRPAAGVGTVSAATHLSSMSPVGVPRMVAVVTGNGLGLLNVSSNILGSAGMLGSGLLGRSNRAHVNAANGNLVLQGLDEFLSGRGADLLGQRTYNSQGSLNDDVDMDGWRWSGEQTVKFSGAEDQRNRSGSVTLTSGDGHVTVYQWVSETEGYRSSEGAGAHDTIKYIPAATESNSLMMARA